jgi:aminocarboxymuconate-semialdehyde decarboxylase
VPRIDLHTHILPERWPDWTARSGYHGWVSLEHHGPGCAKMLQSAPSGPRFFRDVEANLWDPAARLSDMEKTGVTTQVLSTVPVMFSYWAKPQHTLDLARLLNDHIAEVCRNDPAHFQGLATLPMQAPDLAIAELERCVKDLKLPGIQIGSHIERRDDNRAELPDWNLSDPALFAVFEAAARLNACIFVHPWDMMGSSQMPKYWLPWLVGMPAESSRAICSIIFGGILERLPTLRIAFAHGGGSFPGTIGRIQHGFETRPDLCAIDNTVSPRDYLATPTRPARFYVDSLVHDAPTLHHLLNLFGPERIALGSDYPFPLGEAEPGKLIESMNLPAATRDRLVWQTARDFIGR